MLRILMTFMFLAVVMLVIYMPVSEIRPITQSVSFAEEPPSSHKVTPSSKLINGYSWKKFTEFKEVGRVLKSVFIRGVVTGLLISDSPNKKALVNKFFVADTETYIKALDKFYDDYRNINIPVGYALEYVTMEIKGYSSSEIDKQVRLAREFFSR